MPDLFTVTTATNTIKLDSKRQAEASFAVFNSSGQPMRGRARIVVVKPDAGKPSPGVEPPKPEADRPGSDAEKWLALEGEAEREFPIAGAQQYTVNIAVPKDAQPGNYTFRLDMVGVAVPDEQLAEGPSVTFEAPAKGGDDRRWLW